MRNIHLLPLWAVLVLAAVSCGSDSRRDCRALALETINEHGRANPELRKLYDACPRGDERMEAAYFILANLPGKSSVYDSDRLEEYVSIIDSVGNAAPLSASREDKQRAAQAGRRGDYSSRVVPDCLTLNADSVCLSIEQSLRVWQSVPWRERYTREQFLEYVLPCRVAGEPLEYYWKWDCLTRFRIPSDSLDDVAACARAINRAVLFRGDPLLYGAGVQGYSMMLRTNVGKCDDRAIIATMALRAHGIPAACESIPYWGAVNNGHSICSVILPDGRCVGFNSEGDDGQSTYIAQKAPKIYRRMFSLQRETILYRMREREEIPQTFSRFDMLDVTALHGIGCRDMPVDLARMADADRIAWLAVFSPGRWMPVAWAGRLASMKYAASIRSSPRGQAS